MPQFHYPAPLLPNVSLISFLTFSLCTEEKVKIQNKPIPV